MADYELPGAIASIYQVCENTTRIYRDFDGEPPYREVGTEILGTLTSTFTVLNRPLGDIIKRATIMRPEFCLFYWTGILSPVKRDPTTQLMKPKWIR